MKATPKCLKCRSFAVTTVKSLTAAVAAIAASSKPGALPAAIARSSIRPVSSAASGSEGQRSGLVKLQNCTQPMRQIARPFRSTLAFEAGNAGLNFGQGDDGEKKGVIVPADPCAEGGSAIRRRRPRSRGPGSTDAFVSSKYPGILDSASCGRCAPAASLAGLPDRAAEWPTRDRQRMGTLAFSLVHSP